jgi:site-specific DNA recombinase
MTSTQHPDRRSLTDRRADVTACVGYARISRDDDAKGLGVARQTGDIEAFAQRRGWTVERTLVDNDISASRYSKRKRPAYTALLDRLSQGDSVAVVVYDVDRLLRQPKELEALIDLAEKQPITVYGLNGELDLTSADGRFVARILVANAAKESDNISRRTKSKHIELAKDGKPSGGRRAFGYEADRVTLIPAEADLIREAAERFIAGQTLTSIIIDWNARGEVSADGTRWHRQSLKRALKSPRIAGLREHNGVTFPAVWPAIITPEQRDMIAIRFGDTRPQDRARSYLISGLVYCGECGHKMVSHSGRNSMGGRVRRYRCTRLEGGCGHGGIHAEHTEAEVVAYVLDFAQSEPLRRQVEAANRRAADEATPADVVAELEAELAEAWTHYEKAKSKGPIMDIIERIEERLEAARADVANRLVDVLEPDLPPVDQLEAGFSMEDPSKATFSPAVRRAVIRHYIERVTILPSMGAQRFDPRRVDITGSAMV